MGKTFPLQRKFKELTAEAGLSVLISSLVINIYDGP